jgi:flavin-binding protein dodecin
MAEIIAEQSEGSSKRSLTHALADAIKGALKNVDGTHMLNITVIVEGYSVENGKYKVSVKLLIMDLTAEKEKAYQESYKELMERMNANQNLSEQMIAAVYARPIYDQSTPVNALEERMDFLSNRSDKFDFNANDDNISLIAPSPFHDQMYKDYAAMYPQNTAKPDSAPSLDLGPRSGGSSSSDTKEDAA